MYRSEIKELLSSFNPIRLDEMDEVMLMNRVETKYVFCARRLPALLEHLSRSYRILDINLTRNFLYHTTYLDTPDLLFFNQQMRGKLNRHKIRYRRYESTGLSFLEIKKKTNQNRTIKWRIENSLNGESPDKTAAAFIKDYLPYCPDLKPVLINGFNRITLVSDEFKERITLDYDITFANMEGKNSELPCIGVAEIKRERQSRVSPIGNIMRLNGLRPNGFSKYCIGSATIGELQRKNSLKPNLLLINKIENEYFKSA